MIPSEFLLLLLVAMTKRGLAGAPSLREVVLQVNTTHILREQSKDHSYICVTMDWWPNNKCDSVDGESNCAWINASVLSAPISESRLQKAAQGLGKYTLRLGGTLADSITYDLGVEHVNCPDFSPAPPEKAKLFTDGCLTSNRWDEILNFCPNNSECDLIFGLNAMTNRTCFDVDPSRAPCFYSEAKCTNTFDFSNAERLIRHTAARGFVMKGYEFGNELTCLSPVQYASSLKELKNIISQICNEFKLPVPAIIATDSKDPDPPFFSEFVPLVEDVLYAASWHSYPLNAGVYCTGPDAENNTSVDEIIMDPHGMDNFIQSAKKMSEAVVKSSFHSSVETWMGETGGAYDSGCRGSTNTYMSGFWYLNALGAFAVHGHDMFCRQTFTGGNYELVNKITNIPNPDYYSTVLFGRLMGKKVLEASLVPSQVASSLRVYAHCTPENILDSELIVIKGSVTLLFLNYDDKPTLLNDSSLLGSGDTQYRMEYVLTSAYEDRANVADELHSDMIALNGETLRPDKEGTIPPLAPRIVHGSKPLRLPGHSYGFVVYSNAGAAGCT